MRFAALNELTTQNLFLRKFRMDDAECFYQRVGGNERVTKYMLFQPHKSLEKSKQSIEKVLERYETGTTYTWAIALCSDDSVIGRIDLLRFDEEESSCSFAYMIGEDFWGKGFGTEALTAVLGFAFEKLDVCEVLADHMSENGASGAVMKKVGMHHVGKQIGKYEKAGVVYDAEEYKITSEEWLLHKGN